MYRAPSKKRQLIQRGVVYALMIVSVVLVVTFLVFVMLGYRFNRDTSSIQQGGLVQFASRPSDAKVTIGRASLTNTTPSKITVNPGDYDVKMEKRNYLPWQKKVSIKAGEVLWLNYAQLVPASITTDTLSTFDSLSQVKASPNGKYYALIEKADTAKVTIVELSGDKPKQTSVTIPASLRPAGVVSYKVASWSNDSDRLLVTATVKNKAEWLLVKREAASAEDVINLSDVYDSSIKELTFDPRSSERLVLLSGQNELRLIDTAAESLSPILQTNVQSVSPYGSDALFFVRTISKNEQSIDYLSLGSTKSRELKRVEGAQPVLVAAASYFSDPYVAISSGTQLDVYRLNRLPGSQSDDAITLNTVFSHVVPSQPTYLSIRSNGRFVIAQYQKGIATYDLELSKYTLTSLNAGLKPELRWLDRYHFYVTNQNRLTVMEFDGAIPHNIGELSTEFDAVQSDDGKYIYSVTKKDTGFALRRSQMILD